MLRNGHVIITLALAILFGSGPARAQLSAIQKAEMTSINTVRNPGFESGKTLWSASGGTFSTTTTAANVGIGAAAVSWDASGASQTLCSNVQTIPSGLYNQPGRGRIWMKDGDANLTLEVRDGDNNVLASKVLSTQTHFYPFEAWGFNFPTSGEVKLCVKSTADAAIAYFDQAFLGMPETGTIGATAAVGPKTEFTPASAAGFTLSTTGRKNHYVRLGEYALITYKIITVSPAAAEAQVALPTGLTVGTLNGTTAGTDNDYVVGEVTSTAVISSDDRMTVLARSGSSVLRFGEQSVNSGQTPVNGNSIFTNGQTIDFTVMIPIAEWAGQGTVNTLRFGEEYASNISTSTSSDTTTSNFSYGPAGASIAAFAPSGLNAVTKRVGFQTDIQDGDLILIQFSTSNSGWATAGASSNVPSSYSRNDAGTTAYGVAWRRVSGQPKQIDVEFYSAPVPGDTWGGASSFNWRVLKINGALALAGFAKASQTSLGLVKAGQVPGTNTNDAAAAGHVGEYVESLVTTSTNVSNSAWFDMTSISLTAGDWDVTLAAEFILSTGTGVTDVSAGIGTASGTGTTGLVSGVNLFQDYPPTSTHNKPIAVPTFRVSLSATTPIYAKAFVTASGGNPKYRCRLSARRVR